MSNVVQFDPRTRLLKLTNARNILLILGILQVGMHGWVLYSMPSMLAREPVYPEFVVQERMAQLLPDKEIKEPKKYFREMWEKEPERYKELQDKALEDLKVEQEQMKVLLMERSPPIHWSGIASGVFTLFAALLLPWMAGGLSVLSALGFLAVIGVQLYQLGAGGLLNGIIFSIGGLVLYFYASRLALEAETGIRVK